LPRSQILANPSLTNLIINFANPSSTAPSIFQIRRPHRFPIQEQLFIFVAHPLPRLNSGNFSDQPLTRTSPNEIEVFCDHEESTRAADDIVAIVVCNPT
jgi:hypothetical protein